MTVFLSEVPFDQIRHGLEVISAIGTPGRVVSIYRLSWYKGSDPDGHMVKIEWDRGGSSEQPLSFLDKVRVK